jgi:hypothetical protein
MNLAIYEDRARKRFTQQDCFLSCAHDDSICFLEWEPFDVTPGLIRAGRRKGPIETGNGMPVRIELRMVQLCGHSFLEALRDEMLQPFRFIMDFIPRVSKDLMQKRLDQAVMSDYLKGTRGCKIAGRDLLPLSTAQFQNCLDSVAPNGRRAGPDERFAFGRFKALVDILDSLY